MTDNTLLRIVMKISRRKLLAGAAAGAAAPALGGRFSRAVPAIAAGQTVFSQGALGGGGYPVS